jgi:hypothetical protein
MRRAIFCSLILLLPCVLIAQTKESADANLPSVQAGTEFSVYNPDFYCTGNSPFSCGRSLPLIKGIGIFADYNIHNRWGAEGEARWLHWDGEGAQVESTYLIGPRFRIYTWRRMGIWAKFLAGAGGIRTANYPTPPSLKGTMFVYAPGGSVDYRLNRKFAVRVDYEQQKWPTFGISPPHNHSLSPNGFSFGIAYRVWGR